MKANFKVGIPFVITGIVAISLWLGCKPMVPPQTPDNKWQIPIHEPNLPRSELDELAGFWSSESNRVHWNTAETLAGIATQVYIDGEVSEDEFRTLGFDVAEEIRVRNTVVWVLHDVDLRITVVSFRGSDDRDDWKSNFQKQKIPHRLGFVHSGFESLYRSVRARVLASIGSNSFDSLWVTGHSLGGALALLCAEDLESSRKNKIAGLVTFGQPMVFDRKAALVVQKKLSGRYQRFINVWDPVPRTPPFYDHCGSWVWFRDTGVERSDAIRVAYGSSSEQDAALLSDPGPSQMSEAEYQAFKVEALAEPPILRDENGMPVVQGKIPYLSDHYMDQYISSIRTQQAEHQ